MAQRPAVSELVQLFPETTKGTAGAATKRLLLATMELNSNMDFQTFRGSGYKFQTGTAKTREWSSGSIGGALSYDESPYFASSVLKKVTPTQPDAGGNPTVYLWTFEPASTAADDFQTYTVEKGQPERGHRASYVAVNEWGFTATRRGEVSQSGSVMGRAIADPFTLTTSGITEVGQYPVVSDEWDIYVDSTAAGLGGTALLNVHRVSFSIGNRRDAAWYLTTAQSSYSALYEVVPTAQFKMLVDADASGMALFAAAQAETRKFVRFRATGPTISSSYARRITLDMAGKISANPVFSSENDLIAIEFTFNIEHDPTWGKALSLAIQNALSAL